MFLGYSCCSFGRISSIFIKSLAHESSFHNCDRCHNKTRPDFIEFLVIKLFILCLLEKLIVSEPYLFIGEDETEYVVSARFALRMVARDIENMGE